jgi:hypothetical protein
VLGCGKQGGTDTVRGAGGFNLAYNFGIVSFDGLLSTLAFETRRLLKLERYNQQ